MEFVCYAVVALLAYLLGSIPTGYLAARAKGIDIRAVGSGNIGATNVFRFVGKPAGILVLLVDGLKGLAACLFVPALATHFLGEAGSNPAVLEVVAGLSAVVGHNYTLWLGFKGGKGIATSAGVLLAWVPLGLLIAFTSWLLVFAASRYVSAASIAAAAVLPIGVALTRGSPHMIVLTGILSALAIYKHRGNIQRLLAGTEHRFGSKT